MNIVEDKEFNTLFEKITEASDKFGSLALSGCAHLKSKDPNIGIVHAINIAMGACTGPLRATATMLTKGNDSAQQDHVLFAAVMTALCMNISPDGTTMVFDYNPGVIGEALDFVERATGRKFDSLLLPDMVSAAREVQAEAANPLKSFMEARGTKPAAN